jgi:hypothetical protein
VSLPTDAKQRKDIPIYSGFIKYFPDAMAAVAELSRIGNEQHNPGKPLHWDRSKSGDELDALTRHLAEAGTVDTDGVRHSTKVAWRAMANLQKELEHARRSEDTTGSAEPSADTADSVGGGEPDGGVSATASVPFAKGGAG